MKSSFFEYHVASTGLFTARASLHVVNHNIANAETPGYSRQYAMQRANIPIPLYSGKGMVGTGSEVYGVGQIRSFYLDKKYWSERGVLGEYSQKKTQLDMIEALFNDLQSGGLTTAFNDFFDNLQSLTENSGDATYRTNLIQSANTLISLVQLQATALQKQQSDINAEVGAIVDHINSLGQQILSLNRQIKLIETDGTNANDLRDARARLVDELSVYVNVEVVEKEMNADYAAGKYPDDPTKSDKRFIVMINGYEFVNHFHITTLECRARTGSAASLDPPPAPGYEELDPRTNNNEMDAEGLYDIYFTNNVWFNIYSPSLKGELKGLIDVRDGNNTQTNIGYPPNHVSHGDTDIFRTFNTTYKGIPHYLNRLNELLRTFAMAFNEGLYRDDSVDIEAARINGVIGHANGYDRTNEKNTGTLFFYIKPLDVNDPGYPNGIINRDDYLTTGDDLADIRAYYNSINVFNFAINPEILSDPYRIAAAENDLADESDNRVLLSLLKLKDDPSLFREGKLSDYLNTISTELGIDIKQATKFESNYSDVTTNINNQRLSVSGVNIDEEVTAMIKHQQLYQAAARLMSIIDSIYHTTINGLGNW